MNNVYEFISILQIKDEQAAESDTKILDYISVLEFVRSSIAQKHADELSAVLDNAQSAQTLKDLILKYVAEHMAGRDYDREALIDRIYQDMANLGVLTQFLYDPTVEEININGYSTIEIVRNTGTTFLHGEEAFPSPQAALDLTKRMVRMGGMLLDAQTPRVDSYIGSGTRISAIIPPLVPVEDGVYVSIRKQNKSHITREQLVEADSATEEMLEFLSTCLCYGVSIGIAGGTSSGKTTLESFLLNDYIRKNDDYNNRIFLIEDSRELNLIDYDDDHDRPARVIYTQTKGPPNPVSMYDLIKSSLRFDPTLIVPAEVRDEAAFEAAEAGRTGHTILTSFHADGTLDGYSRLVSMCQMAESSLTYEQIFQRCIKAWPIIVHQKQLKDNTRKIMEILEGIDFKDGVIECNMLYRFVVGNIERDEQGHITKVNGFHKRVGPASKELYERLRDNGAAPEILERLFPEYVQLDNSEINPASHLMNPIIEEPANPVVVRPAPPRENSVVENPAVQHVVPTINNPIVENLIVQQEQEPDQASDIIRPADMNNSISLSENHNGKSTITTSSNSVQPRMYPGNRRVRVVQKGVTSVPHRE